MKGYRTIAANAAVLLVAAAASVGITIPVEVASEALIGVVAVVNIFLRFMTDTKVGEK